MAARTMGLRERYLYVHSQRPAIPECRFGKRE